MKAVNSIWLENEAFNRSIPREIDRQTLIDLLRVVEYEAKRSAILEDAGYSDRAPSVDVLFSFVLDALGVPPESDSFNRTSLEELFYNDHLLEHDFETLDVVIDALAAERDKQLLMKSADAARARLYVLPNRVGSDADPVSMVHESSCNKVELLVIRYLGWLAENLTGDVIGGYPSAEDIRSAHQCCDRIEHVAQYAIEGLPREQRARRLEQDVAFMRRILDKHADKLGVGKTTHLPTVELLDSLSVTLKTLMG